MIREILDIVPHSSEWSLSVWAGTYSRDAKRCVFCY